MNRRRSSLAGSPVLVGAATVLIALVAVVLSYNANSGLPFIETYDIRARVADAKKLTTGVDVRIGGKRVGQLQEIEAEADDGEYHAMLTLKLDRAVAELPADSTIRIRPKSVIGAKYIELTPGRASRTIPPGGLIREPQTSASVDLDEVTGLFDAGLRSSVRNVVEQVSDGVAGRGADFNRALDVLPENLTRFERFMGVLADPETNLGGFLRGADAATQALVPVLGDIGPLLRGARTTLGALADEADALGAGLERLPPTLREARRASVALRPVLRDAAVLARELRPGADALPATVRALHGVARRGTPILRRVPRLTRQLDATMRSVDGALHRDATTTSLVLLRPTLESLLPTLQTIVPLQTKCSYVTLFARNASSVTSEGDVNGNWFRTGLLLSTEQLLKNPRTDPIRRYNVYPDERCLVGNEDYRQEVPTGSFVNPRTSAPAGSAKGPEQ
ncbi:MAG: MlaD family protein [Solirubrobacteraceae bacterium]|nr:MlaD family protein [Solirubrobacteraceae bacterium]